MARLLFVTQIIIRVHQSEQHKHSENEQKQIVHTLPCTKKQYFFHAQNTPIF